MDIATARTFLVIAETGSFAGAAHQLYVTQSTVSSRIRVLEQELGARVFDRGKQGARLTEPGRRFLRHAEAIVRAWNQAQLSAGTPAGMAESLTLAAPATLWDGFLLPALPAIRQAMPEAVIRGELSNAAEIFRRIIAGTLDLALHYRPEAVAGVSVLHLADDELVLVTSEPEPEAESGGTDEQGSAAPYLYIDWGPVFQADHAAAWPTGYSPEITLDIGAMAVGYLLQTPASAYLPVRNVARYLDTGRLRVIPDTPRFQQPVYAVMPADPAGPVREAFQVLQQVAVSRPAPA
jgi:DNA-binding transcriptional LysR family regulator